MNTSNFHPFLREVGRGGWSDALDYINKNVAEFSFCSSILFIFLKQMSVNPLLDPHQMGLLSYAFEEEFPAITA
jgi:hypothetical protein